MNEVIYPSWEEMMSMASGTTLRDWFEGDVRCIIKRSHASITAYIGVNSGHPLANHDYDEPVLSGTGISRQADKKWLDKEVEQEVKMAVSDFKKLMEIAEKSGNYIHLD